MSIATELRIGNLVTVDNPNCHPQLKGVPLAVTGVQSRGVDYCINLEHVNQKPNTYYETYAQFDKFIKPIELTQDWLVYGFGFEKSDTRFYIGGLDNLLNRQLDLILCTDKDVISYQNYLRPILTVHHLQNLYHSKNLKELILRKDYEIIL